MASEVESGVLQGREALAREMASLRDRFAAERENRQKEWAEGLDQLSQHATAKHEDRLQTACDTWIVSSVRRLNEHGQSTIESLMRSHRPGAARFLLQSFRKSCGNDAGPQRERGRDGSFRSHGRTRSYGKSDGRNKSSGFYFSPTTSRTESATNAICSAERPGKSASSTLVRRRARREETFPGG